MLVHKDSTLKTEAIFSEDGAHRYRLKKIWDSDKPVITLVTMYPHYDGVDTIDLTTMLSMNEIVKNGEFGAINFVNLYSNIDVPSNRKHIANGFDNFTDVEIMNAASESSKIILAYGSYAKRPLIEPRVNEVLDMLKPHQNKLMRLIQPLTGEIAHPLNTYVRNSKWILKKEVIDTEKKAVKS